jgi:AraC-like DNA-binding protein
MDPLSEMVDRLRTEGQLYGRLEFAAPWGFRFPGEKGICLMVTRGSCFLGVNEQEPLSPLVGGDFVFLSAPRTYSLRSSPEIRLRAMEEMVSEEEFRRSRLITFGGGGIRTSVIAGCFRFATPESEWLAGYLPPVIHVSAPGAHSPQWFQSTQQFVETEIVQDLPGSSAVVDRLAEVLFIHALRTCISSPAPGEKASWLQALADPQMGAALRLMHTEPDRTWTVPELARAVSMSRSAFAARFKELVGSTPMDHLTEWRMVRAASLLRERPDLKLGAVAAAVGYESETAFGKVFRRQIGATPAQYRRNADRERLEPADGTDLSPFGNRGEGRYSTR